MGNEFAAADFQPHLVYGLNVKKHIANATGSTTILAGGYHQKMRLRQAIAHISTLAANATEMVFSLYHGGNVVVNAADMADATGSAIGDYLVLTVVDQYKDLDPEDAVYLTVTTADGGTSTILIDLEYELVE